MSPELVFFASLAVVTLRPLRFKILDTCAQMSKPVTAKIAKLRPQRTQIERRRHFTSFLNTPPSFITNVTFPSDIDVAQRIAVDGDDVGVGAGRDHADLARHIEHVGGA